MKVNFQKHMLRMIVGLLVGNSILLCCCLWVLTKTFLMDAKEPTKSTGEVVQEVKNPTIALADLPEEYAIEDAQKDGCIVVVANELVWGMEQWFYFVIRTEVEVNDFIRITTYDNESSHTPDICDIYYKNGRYIMQRKKYDLIQESQYLTLNYKQVENKESKTIYNFYYLAMSQSDKSATVLSSNKVIYYKGVPISQIYRYAEREKLDLDNYTPEMASQDQCIVIEDNVITAGWDLWLTFLAQNTTKEVRIVSYEKGKMPGTVFDISYHNDAKPYYYRYSHKDNYSEILNYKQSFFDKNTGTVHYVFCNMNMSYEKWDRGFREDFEANVRNILAIPIMDVKEGV